MKKPWAGRFKESTAASVEDFTESISFDWRLWPYDIEGSIAHTRMLAHQGILKKNEAKEIISGLKEIHKEIEQGVFQWKKELEDVHMNIEHSLIEKIGPVGGKLHTARSRNDQIALDLRLYLRDTTREIIKGIKAFQKRLLSVAEKEAETIMPGYTHLQHAQPVVLAQHLLAYVEMFQRDRERYEDGLKRIDTMPLGACALAGTTLPTDRTYLARILKFKRVAENSMDAVSDRDFIIEFLAASAIMMMHFSRLSEELILWATEEFSFIDLPDAYTTGSSIMPQKKNPDVLELIRGKTGRVYGSLMSLLTTMKALPLTYNRDMQEDKIPLFDTVDTIRAVLSIMTEMFPRIRFNRKRMREASTEGYTLATDIAEYLVMKGVPFRQAHEVTGQIVRYAIERGKGLEELSAQELKGFSSLIEDDIRDILDVEKAIRRRKSRGATSPSEIKKQIQRYKRML